LYANNRIRYSTITYMALLVSTTLGFTPAHATDIYRWVDESGQTHFSDTAPPRSKTPVSRIDSRQYELSPEQRKEAEARATKAKADSGKTLERKAATEVPPATASRSEVGTTAAKPSAPAIDCATKLRRYWESSECYAPFFNTNGSIKPNALETCGPAVPYPAQECS
jgi:hypothetical protein